MKIISEATLKLFRGLHRCEWCRGLWHCDAAHVFGRGVGGGFRLDVPINLVSLCRPCHDAHHAGREPTRSDLLAIVAARHNLLQPVVEEALKLLRRLDKLDSRMVYAMSMVGCKAVQGWYFNSEEDEFALEKLHALGLVTWEYLPTLAGQQYQTSLITPESVP